MTILPGPAHRLRTEAPRKEVRSTAPPSLKLILTHQPGNQPKPAFAVGAVLSRKCCLRFPPGWPSPFRCWGAVGPARPRFISSTPIWMALDEGQNCRYRWRPARGGITPRLSFFRRTAATGSAGPRDQLKSAQDFCSASASSFESGFDFGSPLAFCYGQVPRHDPPFTAKAPQLTQPKG